MNFSVLTSIYTIEIKNLNVGDKSLRPLVVSHLYHGAAGLGLHEEDLGHVTVLTHEIEQPLTVHLTHGQIVHNHHAAPGARCVLKSHIQG